MAFTWQNILKWPQTTSYDRKQPQNKPQIYVWGQCWRALSNFLVKKVRLMHFVAFNGLNWPQPTSKSAPTASRLSLRWQYFFFQSYLSTQNMSPLSLLELLQIGFVISQICIDFANLHIIMITPQKPFLKKILRLFWLSMKVSNSKT